MNYLPHLTHCVPEEPKTGCFDRLPAADAAMSLDLEWDACKVGHLGDATAQRRPWSAIRPSSPDPPETAGGLDKENPAIPVPPCTVAT